MSVSSPENGSSRLEVLRVAFAALIAENHTLAFAARDDAAIEFEVRLGGDSAAVSLRVRPDGAELMASSGPHAPGAGTTLIHDQLTVDLASGYHWNDARCTADELAHLLFKHMLRRLDAAGSLEREHH